MLRKKNAGKPKLPPDLQQQIDDVSGGRSTAISLSRSNLTAVPEEIRVLTDLRRAELDAAMKEIGQEHLDGIREDLDLYEDIRNTIGRLMSMLADMNTLTPEIHRGTDFEQLYSQLATSLQV